MHLANLYSNNLNNNYKAIRICLDYLKLDQKNANIYNDLGTFYIKLGNFDSALRYLNISNKLNKNIWQPYSNMGEIYMRLKIEALSRYYFDKSDSIKNSQSN